MTLHKTILLTGSTGLVGRSVAKSLMQQNIQFIGTYNQHNKNITWPAIKADLGKDELQILLTGHSFDTIIHCAGKIPDGINTYEDCYLKNGEIDDSVIEYAASNGVKKFIFISTTNVYGFTDRLITEDSEPIVENLYSKRKLETENKLLSQKDFISIILRINAPYGEYQNANTVLKIFVEKALANYVIKYHGTGCRQQDFTHVDDIADAVLGCLKYQGENEIFNISAGKPVSMKQLAEIILSLVPEPDSKIESSGLIDSQENYKALFDISKAKNKLGWEPRISLKEGISKLINHLQN